MQPLHRFRTAALAALLALASPAALAAQDAATVPTRSARISLREFAALRWIVGDWRGAGVDGTPQAPFFERYRFADDSTLLVESFADSTFTTPTETTRWELRGGRLANSGAGAQWTAVRIDARTVEFAPLARARNSFRWARTGSGGSRPAEWRATISWTDAAGGRQQRFYRMQRLR